MAEDEKPVIHGSDEASRVEADQIRREMASVRAIIGDLASSMESLRSEVRRAVGGRQSGGHEGGGERSGSEFVDQHIRSFLNSYVPGIGDFFKGVDDFFGTAPEKAPEMPAEAVPETPPAAPPRSPPPPAGSFDVHGYATPPEPITEQPGHEDADGLESWRETVRGEAAGTVDDLHAAVTKVTPTPPELPEVEAATTPTPPEVDGPEPATAGRGHDPSIMELIKGVDPVDMSDMAEVAHIEVSAHEPVEWPEPFEVSAGQHQEDHEQQRGSAGSSASSSLLGDDYRAPPLSKEDAEAPYLTGERQEAEEKIEATGSSDVQKELVDVIKELNDNIKQLIHKLGDAAHSQGHAPSNTPSQGFGTQPVQGMPGHMIQPGRPAPQDHGQATGELVLAIARAAAAAGA